MLRVAFQMDSDVIVGRDVTVKFIQEAQCRGHEVFFYQPNTLSFFETAVVADACSVAVRNGALVFGKKAKLDLQSVHILFIRQNPPFDMRYITTTYLLERLTNVLFINDPKSIRNNPEKLLPLSFQEFIPPTLVTENASDICEFYEEYGDVIMKPLYSYGGHGVVRICGATSIRVIAEVMVERYCAPVVVQKFIPNEGADKRVILLSGKPIGVIKRKVSSADEIRANMRVGAVPCATELSERECAICAAVGEKISSEIAFAGIDLLEGYLLEINITSPCGILEINDVYDRRLEKDCWDHFESMVSSV